VPTRRDNRVSRRAPLREPATRILIYCGGLRTEPNYFEGLRRHAGNRSVVVEVRRRGVSPEQLCRAAMDFMRRSGASYDEVWCVFDVDNFDITAARQAADRGGIALAVSNPCFELWLLLHHEETRRHAAGCDAVTARLKKHVPAYDKTDIDFEQFVGGLEKAVAFAKSLDPTGTEHSTNPSTSVWRIAEKIIGSSHG
jgi:hypothetical protein